MQTAADPQAVADPQAAADRASNFCYIWLLVAIFIEYARPASFIPFLRIPLIYSMIPVALLLVTFSAKGLRSMGEVMSDPVSKWVFTYLALITLSVFYAIVGEFAFEIFKFAFGFTMLFLLISRIVTTDARLYGVVFTLLGAHLFLLGMNPNVILEPETRNYILGATFLGDGNDFSLSLCILFPCTLEISLSARKTWHKLTIWGGLLLMIFAIIASQSRGALLGIGAVVIWLWLNSPRRMASLAAIAIAVGIGLLYAPSNYFDRMKTISDYQNEGSAMGRIQIWKAGTRMALDNPVFGVGAGNFPVAYGTRYKPADTVGWKNAHSAYYQVWGELGTLGLLTFFAILLSNFWQNWRVRQIVLARAAAGAAEPIVARHGRRLYMLNAAQLGYMVAGAFLSSAYYPHIFIIAGLGLAARRIALTQTGAGVIGQPKRKTWGRRVVEPPATSSIVRGT
jgi:putative inorganic carbon (hco3(-)) transporter